MNKNIDERKLNLNTQYFHEIRDKFLEMGYSSLMQTLDGLLKYTCDAFNSTELRLKSLMQDDGKNEKKLIGTLRTMHTYASNDWNCYKFSKNKRLWTIPNMIGETYDKMCKIEEEALKYLLDRAEKRPEAVSIGYQRKRKIN